MNDEEKSKLRDICIDSRHYRHLKHILYRFRHHGVVIEPECIDSFLITQNTCHLICQYGTANNNFDMTLWFNTDGEIDCGTCECCGYNYKMCETWDDIVRYLKYWRNIK